MGNNSLRCWLACILPCGALDLIRIVHLNGHVEELSRSISAREVMEANPNHVLTRPCSQGVKRRILIISPDSELKRGHIYFVIPYSSIPELKKKKTMVLKKKKNVNNSHELDHRLHQPDNKAGRMDRRLNVWRPHLESVSEDF